MPQPPTRKPKKLTGRGGPGRGQGRKKVKFDYVPHVRRPPLDPRYPIHVSLRVMKGLPSLRSRNLWPAVRQAFVFGCESRGRFRLVHFGVRDRDIELLCEAEDRRGLSRGVQGLKIRIARGINKVLDGRRGTVFADRYHERVLRTPAECRHALAFVLSGGDHGEPDRFSSAAWFDGWAHELSASPVGGRWADGDADRPVALPRTWLLRGGWKRAGGLIATDAAVAMPAGAPPLARW